MGIFSKMKEASIRKQSHIETEAMLKEMEENASFLNHIFINFILVSGIFYKFSIIKNALFKKCKCFFWLCNPIIRHSKYRPIAAPWIIFRMWSYLCLHWIHMYISACLQKIAVILNYTWLKTSFKHMTMVSIPLIVIGCIAAHNSFKGFSYFMWSCFNKNMKMIAHQTICMQTTLMFFHHFL